MDLLQTFECRSTYSMLTAELKLQALVLLENCERMASYEPLFCVGKGTDVYLPGQLVDRDDCEINSPESLAAAIGGLTFQLERTVLSGIALMQLEESEYERAVSSSKLLLEQMKQKVIASEPLLLELVWAHRPFSNSNVSIVADPDLDVVAESVSSIFYNTMREFYLTTSLIKLLSSDTNTFESLDGSILRLESIDNADEPLDILFQIAKLAIERLREKLKETLAGPINTILVEDCLVELTPCSVVEYLKSVDPFYYLKPVAETEASEESDEREDVPYMVKLRKKADGSQ